MIGQEKVYETLERLGIGFDYIEHPPAPTIEIARQYWTALEGKHCKNLFSGTTKATGITWWFSIVTGTWRFMTWNTC